MIVSPVLGGMAAAAVVSALLPYSLSVRTTLGGGTSIVQGLFIEIFLTAELVFTILMLAAEKHHGQFLGLVDIGLSLFLVELVGVYYTGGLPILLDPLDLVFSYAILRGYHWIY